jgi:TonB-dependent SusC/RagA subfamily outer membrane receptor
MKNKILIFSATIFCFLVSFGFISNDDLLKKLLDNFATYHQKNIQEKVYIHTDKPYYSIGDEIWFKAYVVDAQFLTPTPQSSILNVDLINQKDSIKKTLRIPLVAGFGYGNFKLTDSLEEGNYRLRAYTTWMRNFGDEFYFDRTIKIGNSWSNQVITNVSYQFAKDGTDEKVTALINYSNIDGFPYANKEVSYNVVLDFRNLAKGKAITDDKGNVTINFVNDKPFLSKTGNLNTSLKIAESTIVNKQIPIKGTSNDVDIQFFPEGGELLENVRNRVAFKAVGSDGLGKAVKGYVQDLEGNKVVNFTSKHLGMGVFTLIPATNKPLEAIVTFIDGSEKTIKLPNAKAEGIIVNVNSAFQDSVLVRVVANGTFLDKNKGKSFTVIAQNSGKIIFTAQSALNSLAFATKLPKSRFPSGITQFTLFNEYMLPVSERLIFIAPKDTLSLDLATDKTNFKQREKTKISIVAKDAEGNPVIGSFSMSVIDESLVPLEEEKLHTIFTDLLLVSDIKGYVENPNYYFTDINDEKVYNLDILMMTQGWRRFKWQNITNNSYPLLNYKPERTLSVSGKVTQGRDKPVVGGTVTLFSSLGASFLIQAKTDNAGEFTIDSLFFPDSTKFVIQARTDKGKKNVEIELYNNPIQIVTANPNWPDLSVNINQSMLAYLKNSKTQYEAWLRNGTVFRSIMLGEVKVVETKRVAENSTNLNGAGNADKVFTAADLQNAITLQQAIQGRVAGLMFMGGIPYIRNQPAQVILDGMFVEADFLSNIPPQDVESVEILKSISYTAIYGSRGGGGVIIVTTKRGKSGYSNNTYAPGILTYNPIGIFEPKEFYVPNYQIGATNANTADLRTTIYWNPKIITDGTKPANVEFYNADGNGNYKIILEGMDLNGHIGRKVLTYKVTP